MRTDLIAKKGAIEIIQRNQKQRIAFCIEIILLQLKIVVSTIHQQSGEFQNEGK